MKGRVIKEFRIGGAFEGEFTEEKPYGYKISFLAGSEWNLSIDDMKGVKCVKDDVFVRIPEELASEIFGEWMGKIMEFKERRKND